MAAENGLAEAQKALRWHWRESQMEIKVRYPTNRPPNPTSGDGWFNEATATFCVWDGRHWVSLPVD
jgi:hypothetical protein